jgi:hypothetical protein
VLTVFSVPKPFVGHIGVIQRNAIRSWTRLRPECQVILCGDEPGTREAAAEFRAEWIPGIAQNEFGTPLVSSVFEVAEERATNRLLCYVNADVMLLSDFTGAARRVAAAELEFLMIGQRWDLDVTDEFVHKSEWEIDVRRRVTETGVLHPPWGSDYFVYPSGTIGPLPAFAVGRPAWDNWMIYDARRRGIPVVDATASVLVIHQNHDYAHVKMGSDGGWEGPEADRNRALLGDGDRIFLLADATHRLLSSGLVPIPGGRILKDGASAGMTPRQRFALLARAARAVRRTGR